MKIEDRHRAYLERVARHLSRELGKPVSPAQVLASVLDLALQDEEMFDPEDPGNPISPLRRQILRTATSARTSALSPPELLDLLLRDRDLHSDPLP